MMFWWTYEPGHSGQMPNKLKKVCHIEAMTIGVVKVSWRRCADADAIMNFDFSDVMYQAPYV